MRGKIMKGISGFYYVHVVGSGLYECKAKGVFRQQKVKPLVGDNVMIDVIDEAEKKGNICEILPRENELIRPAVSNIDLALLIFASAKPDPNFHLLDRFLFLMQYQEVPVMICFNKADLVTQEQKEEIRLRYAGCGCGLIFTSIRTGEGITELEEILADKTTAVAGPSGVGKSSLINLLAPNAAMETGELSRKIDRGKHTTRHSEIIHICNNTYIMDTPGFSTLDIPGMEKEQLWQYFAEFLPYEPNCRFQGCQHVQEPDCGVKQAVEEDLIPKGRYENYLGMYQELKDRKRY